MEDLVKKILQPNLNREREVNGCDYSVQEHQDMPRKQTYRIEGAEIKTKCRENLFNGITVENPLILKEGMAIQTLKRHRET